MKLVLVILFVACAISAAWSQEDCEQTLTRATDEFNAGHFYGIASILKPCLDNGFSREQRQRAYLLLAQTYLLLDDPIGAEDSYLRLLRANPEFVTDRERDPMEIVYLSSKFTASPIFTLFAKAGVNTSFERVIVDLTTDGNGNSSEKHTIKPGLQIGGGIDWNFDPLLSLSVEALYSYQSISSEEMKFDRNKTARVENQHWFKFPLSLKYTGKPVGKFNPYAYAGVAIDLLSGARGNFVTTNSDSSTREGDATLVSLVTDGAPENLMDARRRLNLSWHAGVGAKYKIGLDYVSVDLRYSMGLTNIVRDDKLYANRNLYAFYGYVDNFYRLDNVYLSVGFIHPLYKPRKLKKARTKSILRKLIKEKQD